MIPSLLLAALLSSPLPQVALRVTDPVTFPTMPYVSKGYEVYRFLVPLRPTGETRTRMLCVAWVGLMTQQQRDHLRHPNGALLSQHCYWDGELPHEPVKFGGYTIADAYDLPVPITATKTVEVFTPDGKIRAATVPDMYIQGWFYWHGYDAEGKYIGDPIGGGPLDASRVLLSPRHVQLIPSWSKETQPTHPTQPVRKRVDRGR